MVVAAATATASGACTAAPQLPSAAQLLVTLSLRSRAARGPGGWQTLAIPLTDGSACESTPLLCSAASSWLAMKVSALLQEGRSSIGCGAACGAWLIAGDSCTGGSATAGHRGCLPLNDWRFAASPLVYGLKMVMLIFSDAWLPQTEPLACKLL